MGKGEVRSKGGPRGRDGVGEGEKAPEGVQGAVVGTESKWGQTGAWRWEQRER